MPTYWENDLPPAAGAAPAAPKPQQPQMQQPQPQMQQRPQRPAPGGGGGRWWQNPGGGVGSAGPVRPPVGGQPPAPAPAPAPQPAPAGGAPAPYNAGARFAQPPAAPAPAAPAPAPAPAAAPPAPAQQPAPAQAGSLQAAPSEGNASQVWAKAMQGAGRNFAGVDPDRARLDQMSRMDAARNPNASMYGNPGGMDRPDMQQDHVYSTVEDRDPGMSGGGSSIRAWGPGEGGGMRDRALQMEQMYGRRSKAFGPPPPTGVASYGVGPVGGAAGALEGGDYDRQQSQMDAARAIQEQQQQAADQPAPPAPAPEGSIDPGRAAMGLGRGLPPPRRPMMPMRRPMGRGRGPIY